MAVSPDFRDRQPGETDGRRHYGAGEGNRTPDLFITSESLCRLSYPGENMASDPRNEGLESEDVLAS